MDPILHEFTDKSIKCTFWLGLLPLQGTPTGKNNGVLIHFTLFYRTIDKMHILARNVAPARNTDRQKLCYFITCYTILHTNI